jgi:PPOX class probable F420-dependent enzyme
VPTDLLKKPKHTLTSTGWALKLLTEARVGHLATSTRKGRLLVVPICFALGSRAIYSAIDQKPKRIKPLGLRRVRNIVENQNVCLTVDEYEEDWGKLRYVIVQAKATLLTRGREHGAALSLLREKYRQYRYMELEGRPIIKIQPLRIIEWKATPSSPSNKTVKPKEYP